MSRSDPKIVKLLRASIVGIPGLRETARDSEASRGYPNTSGSQLYAHPLPERYRGPRGCTGAGAWLIRHAAEAIAGDVA